MCSFVDACEGNEREKRKEEKKEEIGHCVCVRACGGERDRAGDLLKDSNNCSLETFKPFMSGKSLTCLFLEGYWFFTEKVR